MPLHEAPRSVDHTLALHQRMRELVGAPLPVDQAAEPPLQRHVALARHPSQSLAVGVEGDDRLEGLADVADARVCVVDLCVERGREALRCLRRDGADFVIDSCEAQVGAVRKANAAHAFLRRHCPA
jgi:hypothetical protein